MNISCEIIRDLLPLYHDGVCNEDSKKLVETHIHECTSCAAMLEKIRDNTLDNRFTQERRDVVEHHTRAVKRKSFITGISIASVLAIPVLVSLIVNLATNQGLDWFFIVLTSLMLFASITVVPLVFEKDRGIWTLGCFTASLMILLLTIAIYSGGNWFFVTTTPIIFGLSICFAPYVLSKLPLKGFTAYHKGFLSMAINTLLLFAVIIVSGIHAQVSSDYWGTAFSITFVCLLLPWSLFLTIRYAKLGVLVKIGLCFVLNSLFLSVIVNAIDWILTGAWYNRFAGANLLVWGDISTLNANIHLLILLTGLVVGGILIAIGLIRKSIKRS